MLHLTKKDFRVDWYSGSGAGGQHRNKHQNCCRITHIDSGISCVGTHSKSRESNKRQAFLSLSRKIIAMHNCDDDKNVSNIVIRNYNEHRNEVHDKASGVKQAYTEFIKHGIGLMIESRHRAMSDYRL